MPMSLPALIAVTIALLPGAATVADDIFAERPAFSAAEQPAKAYATCAQLRKMSDGLPELEYRRRRPQREFESRAVLPSS